MADGGYARLALFRAEFRGCSRSVTTEVTTPRWQELASRQFCKQYGIVGQTGIWVDIGQQWTASFRLPRFGSAVSPMLPLSDALRYWVAL